LSQDKRQAQRMSQNLATAAISMMFKPTKKRKIIVFFAGLCHFTGSSLKGIRNKSKPSANRAKARIEKGIPINIFPPNSRVFLNQ